MEYQIDPDQFLPSFEDICLIVNNIFDLTFFYLKYVLFFIVLIIGILTLLSLRGRFFFERLVYNKGEELPKNPVTKPRIIIGTLYIIIAFGILFNWFIYLLIIVLNPLPDRFLFNFISFSEEFNAFNLNTISEISLIHFDHEFEKTLYYIFASISFIGNVNIIVGIWIIVSKGIKYTRGGIRIIVVGIVCGFLTGFTTCLPLFL